MRRLMGLAMVFAFVASMMIAVVPAQATGSGDPLAVDDHINLVQISTKKIKIFFNGKKFGTSKLKKGKWRFTVYEKKFRENDKNAKKSVLETWRFITGSKLVTTKVKYGFKKKKYKVHVKVKKGHKYIWKTKWKVRKKRFVKKVAFIVRKKFLAKKNTSVFGYVIGGPDSIGAVFVRSKQASVS